MSGSQFIGRPSRRLLTLLGAASIAIVAGCSTAPAQPSATAAPSAPSSGGSPAASSAITQVQVAITKDGCTASPASVPAGAVTFVLNSDASSLVLEMEVEQGETRVGEKEGLTPGSTATLTLQLAAGNYVLHCPGGTTDGALAVTADTTAQSSPGAMSALLAQATAAYAEYVRTQVNALVTATGNFATAVEAGDVAAAKSLYPTARIYYERIEPVAEAFGDLDPEIDGRANDAATPADFIGFHRIEQALWMDNTTAGMGPIAQGLVANVARLKSLVATQTYQPTDLANGASELLDEVAASKITGEEERYSRIDQLDFQANLDGAKQAFTLLEPALRIVDPTLASTVDGAFADVQSTLDGYRSGDGFVTYDKLTSDDTKKLAQHVAALAEPLSQVAAKIVGQ
jgi:iron uptake system component EfeO